MDRIRNRAIIAYYNTKTLPMGIIILAIVYCVGIIVSVQIIQSLQFEPVYIGEYLLPLLGILCFTHLAIHEKDGNIHEMTYVREVPHDKVVIIRFLMYAIGVYGIIWITFLVELAYGEDFNLLQCVHGSYITLIYLGVIGMITAYITGQKSVGYILPFAYYMMDMFTKGKYTKGLYLFSLTNNDWQTKFHLLGVSSILMIGFIVYLNKKS